MDLFTYLMAKNDHNTSVKKDLFSYLLGKGQSGTYTDYSGTSLSINNTKKGKMAITLKGNTSQTGTPTPDNPIPVNVVSGDNTITIANSDNTQSTSYPINLPVENLLNVNKTPEYTYTSSAYELINNGVKVGNNSTSDYSFIGFYIDGLKANTTYTISFDATISNSIISIDIMKMRNTESSSYRILKYDKTTSGHYSTQFTTTEDVSSMQINLYSLRGTYQANAVTTYTNLQIEEGTKANLYTPYGTTPIELCKIGDYQDYFTKNSGKNLLNANEVLSYTISTGNGRIYPTSDRYSYLVEVKPNTQYTFSRSDVGTASLNYIALLETFTPNGNNNYISANNISSNLTSTFTTTANTHYVMFLSGSGVSSNIMLEEGNQATTYEPHGTGQWCKYNAIGKVVLDGSEDWNYSSSPTFFYIVKNDMNTTIIGYSNNYKWYSTIGSITDSYGMASYTYSNVPYLRIKNTDYTNTTDFKTWLSTHNTIVYYSLATPYLSLIEDNNLIEQLNEIEKAQSYNGQTNINQTNNDLPFELDVSVKVGN